LKVTSFLIQL